MSAQVILTEKTTAINFSSIMIMMLCLIIDDEWKTYKKRFSIEYEIIAFRKIHLYGKGLYSIWIRLNLLGCNRNVEEEHYV